MKSRIASKKDIMRLIYITILVFVFSTTARAQLYFPPNNKLEWDTISPTNLGWCQHSIDSLYHELETHNTKAFILLKDGKIVLEKYFDGHSATANWYWASAGKSLTSFLVGIAQQENKLSLDDKTSKYLDENWTSCTLLQEDQITIRHQLTMTSGLNDGVTDPFCTESSCLRYLAAPGTRWAYHNAPYTLLDQVMEKATGQTLNTFVTQKLKNQIGMDGWFVQQDYNNIFFSTARSMARYGLLILNKGNWNGKPIMTDTTFFNAMVNTSQNLNKSYGYLWWLNGKASYMVPQSQFVFQGSLMPNAPADMIAALGKNGQFINVVPSQNLVWIRMGNDPDDALVSFTFCNEIWRYLNQLNCQTSSIEGTSASSNSCKVYPNPANDVVFVESHQAHLFETYAIYNNMGQLVSQGSFQPRIELNGMAPGVYVLHLKSSHSTQVVQLIKK
jgi:CubicO group peptidase (beta-lactamase class C family)